MTIVYDKKVNEYKVPYAIDVKGWLDAGYTLEKPKSNKPKEPIKDEPTAE